MWLQQSRLTADPNINVHWSGHRDVDHTTDNQVNYESDSPKSFEYVIYHFHVWKVPLGFFLLCLYCCNNFTEQLYFLAEYGICWWFFPFPVSEIWNPSTISVAINRKPGNSQYGTCSSIKNNPPQIFGEYRYKCVGWPLLHRNALHYKKIRTSKTWSVGNAGTGDWLITYSRWYQLPRDPYNSCTMSLWNNILDIILDLWYRGTNFPSPSNHKFATSAIFLWYGGLLFQLTKSSVKLAWPFYYDAHYRVLFWGESWRQV